MSTAVKKWTTEENHMFVFYYVYTGLSYEEMISRFEKSNRLFPFHGPTYSRSYTYHIFETKAKLHKQSEPWTVDYMKGGRLVRYIHPNKLDQILAEIGQKDQRELLPRLNQWNTNADKVGGRRGFGTEFKVRTISDAVYWKDFKGDLAHHTVHPRSWREDWIDAFLQFYANPHANWDDHLRAAQTLVGCGVPTALLQKYYGDLDLIRAARDFWIEWGFLRGEKAEVILTAREAERKERGVVGYSKKVPRYMPKSCGPPINGAESDYGDTSEAGEAPNSSAAAGPSTAAANTGPDTDIDARYPVPSFHVDTTEGETTVAKDEDEDEDESGKSRDAYPADAVLEEEVLDLFFNAVE